MNKYLIDSVHITMTFFFENLCKDPFINTSILQFLKKIKTTKLKIKTTNKRFVHLSQKDWQNCVFQQMFTGLKY